MLLFALIFYNSGVVTRDRRIGSWKESFASFSPRVNFSKVVCTFTKTHIEFKVKTELL
jgi:hypothetical protein